jgi:hypothetical protein
LRGSEAMPRRIPEEANTLKDVDLQPLLAG